MKTINKNGIAQISAFIAENHKLGERISQTPDMLRSWAFEAEFSLSEGNDAVIEIRSFDSVFGRTQTFTVSPGGIDTTPDAE